MLMHDSYNLIKTGRETSTEFPGDTGAKKENLEGKRLFSFYEQPFFLLKPDEAKLL